MQLRKMYFNINGVDRMVMCDPDKDTLADLLRNWGLTGTKVGCGTGQCGSCSVILDGKVIRACTKKVSKIPEFSKIITIEGIGTPMNLHPLQAAWMVHGGVQCGFCSPGFIVSAYGLLMENLSPTREEVRQWFKKHNNVCRCTGYKHLVDGVMAAAEVMRGEKTMEDLQYKMPESGRIYGTSYPRPSALAKVTGTCDYGDDINLKLPDGTLHLAVVLARVNHAKIKGIDFAEAEKTPGYVQAITHKDVQGTNRIMFPSGLARSKAEGFERPIFVEDKVYRYGDIVAVIAASSRRQAREAAAKVKVDYEILPAYMNALDAIAEDAQQIHEDFPNLYVECPLVRGDSEKALEEAYVVKKGSFYVQRQPHLVIEPDTALSYIDEEGRVTIQNKCLDVGLAIGTLCPGLGITEDKMRMIENPTGSSFGYAVSPAIVGVMAVCAMATKRPCALTMSYEEHQHNTGKRMPCYSNLTLAADENGKLTATEFEYLYDNGAYTELTFGIMRGVIHTGFPYKIEHATGIAKGTITNHNFTTAFRAFGSPQIYLGFEQLVDEIAEELNIDPLEFRRRNVFREGDVSICGAVPEVYSMVEIIDNMKPRYDAAVERCKKFSTPEKPRGVGLACGSYIVTTGVEDRAEVSLELRPDGGVTCYGTWSDQGQGGDAGVLVHAHECLRPLGLQPDQFRVIQCDTAICPPSGGALGSRSNVMSGLAIQDAANQMLKAMDKGDGTYRTYDEMVAEGIPVKYLGVRDNSCVEGEHDDYDPNTGQGDPIHMHTYGMFLSEVEVDVATGKIQVLSMDCEGDVGVVTHYINVEGQAFGGMAQGIGLALSEDYDDMKKHATLLGAGAPTIDMVPDELHAHHVETPREHGPHGSGGAAELYLTSPHAAIMNAVYNACGIRIREMPARPQKVLEALKKKAEGVKEEYVPYVFDSDFHEHMQWIKENPVERSTVKGITG